MNHRLLLAIFFLAHIGVSFAQDNLQYTNCSKLVECGDFQGLGYPFWGGNRPDYCGHPSFQINCRGNSPILNIEGTPYRVLSVNNRTQTMIVVGEDFQNSRFCPSSPQNTTLDAKHFEYAPGFQELILYYGCQTSSNIPPTVSLLPCDNLGANTFAVYMGESVTNPFEDSNLLRCGPGISVRVNGTIAQGLQLGARNPVNITQVLDSGFGLVWEANNTDCDVCNQSGGRCGSNSGSFACYCKDQPYAVTCNSNQNTPGTSKNPISGTKIALPIAGAVLAGVGLGWLIFAFKQRRKRATAKAAQIAQAKTKDLSSPSLSRGLMTNPSSKFSRSSPSIVSSTSDFGKASTYFGTQIFSYAELEEATDNFNPARELGDGGFGTVYYGTLQDGRVVAVKRLYENNFKRVEQFMNEVEILTRLHHQHLVNLYGCTSKRSRELLLVYEYIPNGTVADHLHGRQSSSGLLSWPIRLNIAIETADALAYLHASDIIHRDVKTNNILLEKDFRVKVADFGLSRLFPTDVTHVSTAPQGTPGYVDPEYYQCYQLTEKSDVYSFGVVLVELISSKQAVDTNRDRQDINLANMAVSRIQSHALHELVDPSLGFETNSSVTKMVTKVAELAFRCLQSESALRPSMNEILTALRGIESQLLNVQEAEVVDIVIDDDSGLLKGNCSPKSSDSAANDKWAYTNSA